MISIDSLLDMIATEAITGPEGQEYSIERRESNLPPINYPLQLIEKADGSYEWVE